MADAEQLALITQGVGAWNAWLLENLRLTGRDLSEGVVRVDLSGADLREANLEEAYLWGASAGESQ